MPKQLVSLMSKILFKVRTETESIIYDFFLLQLLPRKQSVSESSHCLVADFNSTKYRHKLSAARQLTGGFSGPLVSRATSLDSQDKSAAAFSSNKWNVQWSNENLQIQAKVWKTCKIFEKVLFFIAAPKPSYFAFLEVPRGELL